VDKKARNGISATARNPASTSEAEPPRASGKCSTKRLHSPCYPPDWGRPVCVSPEARAHARARIGPKEKEKTRNQDSHGQSSQKVGARDVGKQTVVTCLTVCSSP